jgi:hypothetical protein
MQLRMVTWMCYSGPVLKTLLVLGMRGHVLGLLGVGTWLCCSGPVLKTFLVLGMRGHDGLGLLGVGTCM